MDKTPGLKNAYALQTPEDSKRLYADWAETYDADFADASDYRLPEAVARQYAARGGAGPVLDLGAGTGLVGQWLKALGVEAVDGTDISREMLDVAAARGCYRRLFESDLTQALNVPDAAYAGAVSAGTFTNGHVGPDALEEVLRVIAPGGHVVFSVNAVHWEAQGFGATLDRLGTRIAATEKEDIAIYGPQASGAHAADRAWLVCLTRAG
ncbi:class I SAM-dependent DNA methyltransferase [Primorskyibacter sp. S187A]|uniref:class I SAM-dependent DNA methyltransferase n=1 Tax=Primorskyibacter sp. S187A TaxID=3415130 RepID=UPI003C7CFB31